MHFNSGTVTALEKKIKLFLSVSAKHKNLIPVVTKKKLYTWNVSPVTSFTHNQIILFTQMKISSYSIIVYGLNSYYNAIKFNSCFNYLKLNIIKKIPYAFNMVVVS